MFHSPQVPTYMVDVTGQGRRSPDGSPVSPVTSYSSSSSPRPAPSVVRVPIHTGTTIHPLAAPLITHHSGPRVVSTVRPLVQPVQKSARPSTIAYANGVEVQIGAHRFRCSSVLGRGSYGEVWKAEVLEGDSSLKEVALKEVCCRSQSELQQAIFEVQVLLALERSCKPSEQLKVPRCISYKVDSFQDGWKVRTAMTIVPGESLDCFVRRKPLPGRNCLEALRRGVVLAVRLIQHVGPSLQKLAPIAWHRDVNSHNILVDGAPDTADESYLKKHATFWLIDFGLAVDSQSWVSASGKWRTEYIGGDSRYWPASSWMMHLLGPEGFSTCPELCEQYQRRLDIHGLGITALELISSMALTCPLGEQEELGAWETVLEEWQTYRDQVWRWWAAVYAVFSSGGDLAPVQARLVEENLVDRLLEMLGKIRSALKVCALQSSDIEEGKLLNVIADMLDEKKAFDLADIQSIFGSASEEEPSSVTQAGKGKPASPLPQRRPSSTMEARLLSSPEAASVKESDSRPGLQRRISVPGNCERDTSGDPLGRTSRHGVHVAVKGDTSSRSGKSSVSETLKETQEAVLARISSIQAKTNEGQTKILQGIIDLEASLLQVQHLTLQKAKLAVLKKTAASYHYQAVPSVPLVVAQA